MPQPPPGVRPAEPDDSRNNAGASERDPDADIIVASATDGDLFGELFERNSEAVLAFFMRRTACPQTAADLTAETFAQAFAARGRFTRTGAPARAWLFTIARRQLARFVRKEQVSAKYRKKLGVDPTVRLAASDLERIEDLADSSPQREAIAEAMTQLPSSQREAVQLRVGEDLPYQEVASRLGCSEGAARVRVSRGLTALADIFETTIDSTPQMSQISPRELS